MAERLRRKLLPTDHYHVTFTLPEELRLLWQCEQLEACRQQLGGGTVPDDDPDAGSDAAEDKAELARDLALEDLFCPVCGRPLEIEAIPRAPPPLELAKYLGPIR